MYSIGISHYSPRIKRIYLNDYRIGRFILLSKKNLDI